MAAGSYLFSHSAVIWHCCMSMQLCRLSPALVDILCQWASSPTGRQSHHHTPKAGGPGRLCEDIDGIVKGPISAACGVVYSLAALGGRLGEEVRHALAECGVVGQLLNSLMGPDEQTVAAALALGALASRHPGAQ
eukprot:scaffold169158_cov38-Prasinocladus_malaysianus.AAC.1